MNKLKKTDKSQSVDNALALYDEDAVINLLRVSGPQQAVILSAVRTMTELASKELLIEREIIGIQEKLKENKDLQDLKQSKAKLRLYKKINRDATNRYNGALELALAETPGKTLKDKYNYLELNNARGLNERE